MQKYLSEGCFTKFPSITPPATPPFPSGQHSAVRRPQPSPSRAPASGFCRADCWGVATALTVRNGKPGLEVAQDIVTYLQRHKAAQIVMLRTYTSLFRSDRALLLKLLHERNREKSGAIQHMCAMLCSSGAGGRLWELRSHSCCTCHPVRERRSKECNGSQKERNKETHFRSTRCTDRAISLSP